MKKLLVAIPVLAAVGLLFAQDRPKSEVEAPVQRSIQPHDGAKEVVEFPIKEIAADPAPVSDTFDLSKTGIDWKKGLDAALRQGKPILLFQLLGNFDDVYC